MRVRNAVLVIILLLIILAVALAIGSVLMLRLFALWVLALVLGYLWAFLEMRGITGQVRELADRCQVGGWFEEEITVFSSSRLPKVLIRVDENTSLPGHHNTAVFSLSPKGSHCWRARVYCQRRGQYTLGAITLTAGDPFGFFSLKRDLAEAQHIIVHPATLELPFFRTASYYELGSGSSRWLISEMGPDAARVREYANGDALTRIHWRSTAHTGKLMVKEFDADHSNQASRNVWIILDMHQASQAGDGDAGTEEYGVTIAASLMKKYIDDGQSVGLVAAAERSYLFAPETGSQHLWKALEALALMKASGNMPVGQLILREIERFGIGSVIIVITPSTSERTVGSLRQVRSRGAQVIVVSLDSASFGSSAPATNASSSLLFSGCQLYVVRPGVELSRQLDSQALVSQTR